MSNNYRNLQHDTAFAQVRYALDCNLDGIAEQHEGDCSTAMMKLILVAIAACGQPKGGKGGWTHGGSSGPKYLGIAKTTYYDNLKPLIAAGLVTKNPKGRKNSPTLFVEKERLHALGEMSTKARSEESLDDIEVGSIDPFALPVNSPAESPAAGLNGATHGASNGANEGALQGAPDGASHGTNDGALHGAPNGSTNEPNAPIAPASPELMEPRWHESLTSAIDLTVTSDGHLQSTSPKPSWASNSADGTTSV